MIIDTAFVERSLLFAKLAKIAYLEKKAAKKAAKELGFDVCEFYEKSGAQAYRFANTTDLVIACRGTQPNEWNDVEADLRAIPVLAETVSRVHKGFKSEVDALWPMILDDLRDLKPEQDLWFCGHSLGAAMATIMASRCKHEKSIPDPEELYTYGSPRVGWRGYCNSLDIDHYRWRNNNDIVTTVPLIIMGYRHHGTEEYICSNGTIRNVAGITKWKDRLKGMWKGLKSGKIDAFSDHSIDEYIKHIENYQRDLNKRKLG